MKVTLDESSGDLRAKRPHIERKDTAKNRLWTTSGTGARLATRTRIAKLLPMLV
jgi:hypothetical protein